MKIEVTESYKPARPYSMRHGFYDRGEHYEFWRGVYTERTSLTVS